MSTKYTYDDVLKASTEYFNGDEFAANVFVTKYALCDDSGNYYELTPRDMHRRLAKEFARIEAKYPNPMSEEEIFNLFDRYKWIIPQGSPMNGIGNPFKVVSLSNCFTLQSPYDSYGGILHTDQEACQIYKRRGGVGFDISSIRPKGLATNNAAKTTDGIGVFMERYSNSCREVAMKGRRGALLLTIDVHHPEVETFIKIKQDKKKVTGANISVKLTDAFMEAVKSDGNYVQKWPVDSKNPLIEEKVRARDVWDKIVHCAWASAEPGVLFWDTVTRNSPMDAYTEEGFGSVSCNPCSEINLSPYDSCRLMAVNLYSFAKNRFEKNSYFDYKLFQTTIRKAQRLMDDLVDLELESINKIIDKIKEDPEPDYVKKTELDLWNKIKIACTSGRRTGLGITGLGDTLAALGLRYGSSDSIEITENIYKHFTTSSYAESIQMAEERGAFSVYDYEKEQNHPFIKRILDSVEELFGCELITTYNNHGRRNIANTTTAPTGSVSIQTQTTSGIEPAFLLKYDRYKKINSSDINAVVDRIDEMGDKWQKYTVYHHGFKEWMDVTGKTEIEQSPYYKATSEDVDWVSSVDIQAAAQKWICHSISKTANIPKDASESLVSDIYIRAWESGCKGFTVYRAGSRDGVLVASDSVEKEPVQSNDAAKRPSTLCSETTKVKLDTDQGVKNAYLTVSFYPDTKKPYEVFVNTPIGTSEGNNSKDLQIIDLSARMTSLALRHGVDSQFVIDQLDKVDGQYFYSIPTTLAKVLRKYSLDEYNDDDSNKDNPNLIKCPSCGEKSYVIEESCGHCLQCSFSKCS